MALLALLGDLSRAALCAAPGMELISGDFSAIESVVLAWLAGETWKLTPTGPSRRPATRHSNLSRDRPQDVRQNARCGNQQRGAAARQGGRTGVPDSAAQWELGVASRRTILAPTKRPWRSSGKWRAAHPRRANSGRISSALCRSQSAPDCRSRSRPDHSRHWWLRLRRNSTAATAERSYDLLSAGPSRSGKFEDGLADIEFHDNSRAQWRPYHGWFGVFVENAVGGIARDHGSRGDPDDLKSAAIASSTTAMTK